MQVIERRKCRARKRIAELIGRVTTPLCTQFALNVVFYTVLFVLLCSNRCYSVPLYFFYSMLFCCSVLLLFCSTLFYSVLLYSFLFYNVLICSVLCLICSVLFYFILFYFCSFLCPRYTLHMIPRGDLNVN